MSNLPYWIHWLLRPHGKPHQTCALIVQELFDLALEGFLGPSLKAVMDDGELGSL